MAAFALGIAFLVTLGFKATVALNANLHDGPGDTNKAVFVPHLKTVLDVPPMSSTTVRSELECGLQCLRELQCLSFHLAAFPDGRNLFKCETLNASKFSAPEKLLQSGRFNYYSLLVRSACVSVVAW